MRLLIMYEVKAMYEAVVCCLVFIGLCVQHVLTEAWGKVEASKICIAYVAYVRDHLEP